MSALMTTTEARAATAALCLILAAAAMTASQAPQLPPRTPADDGFTDTPMLPGVSWRVHDPKRPHPPTVTPGDIPGAPPSDAIVLFDIDQTTKLLAACSAS